MKHRRLVLGSMLLAITAAAVGCHRSHVNNLPPAKMLMEPGPGVGGPGPGVMMNAMPMPAPFGVSQLAFTGPAGIHIGWDATGQGFFDSEPLVAPARQNFPQGAIYRLKLTAIPAHAGEEYYPTIEVGPTTARTEAYLAHNAIPVQFTAQDFDQVQTGNFVTKVIYLPDPEYQELALAAIETLVSTRLDPGVDPVVEADRRGSILAIVRLGNKDLGGPGAGPDGIVRGAGDVRQAGFNGGGGGPMGMPPMGPMGPMGGMGGGPFPAMGMPSHLAGVTTPQYGMPISGTPIGLPGPPHIPMGVPAGLQRHTIKNHTRIHLPKPTKKIHISVEQKPGYSYPKPPNHVKIVEEGSRDGWHSFKQPFCDMFEWVRNK